MIDKEEQEAPSVTDRNSVTGSGRKNKNTTNNTKFSLPHPQPAIHLIARCCLKILCLAVVNDCNKQLKPTKEIMQNFVIGIRGIREELL